MMMGPASATISNTITSSHTSPASMLGPIKGTVSDGISSPDEIQKENAGYVTKKLRVLDMDVVEKIRNELKSVDANSDGRYVPSPTNYYYVVV